VVTSVYPGHDSLNLVHVYLVLGPESNYTIFLERIENQIRDQAVLAKQVLSWITCARRPLTTSELRHALGVEIGTSRFDEENLPELVDMVSVCAGLVTIDKESDIIHYTTQEYFERTWTSWFPNAHMDITNVCVTYLSFDVFEAGFCQSDGEFKARLQMNVLYDYAARNWGYHACTSPIEEDLILNLLKGGAKVSAASQAMTTSGSYSGYSQRVPRQMTGVHIAAYFGLVEMIVGLLKKEYNPDLQDSYRRTPLSWAAEKGHEAVVKLLLVTEKVDVDSKDSDGQTPLSWAAEGGHEAVVKLLQSRCLTPSPPTTC
jgi:Ankyrin repeats (3 copies)